MFCPFNCQSLDKSLFSFIDYKRDEQFRFPMRYIRGDLYVLVSVILIECGNTASALLQKLVTKLSSRQEFVFLDGYLLREFVFVDVLIATKRDTINLLSRSPVDLVHQINLAGLLLEFGRYLHAEETF